MAEASPGSRDFSKMPNGGSTGTRKQDLRRTNGGLLTRCWPKPGANGRTPARAAVVPSRSGTFWAGLTAWTVLDRWTPRRTPRSDTAPTTTRPAAQAPTAEDPTCPEPGGGEALELEQRKMENHTKY